MCNKNIFSLSLLAFTKAANLSVSLVSYFTYYFVETTEQNTQAYTYVQ